MVHVGIHTINAARRSSLRTRRKLSASLDYLTQSYLPNSRAHGIFVYFHYSAQGLKTNLLIPEQRTIRSYRRDRVQIVPRRATNSRTSQIDFSQGLEWGPEHYKALEELDKATKFRCQLKRNVPPQRVREMLRELASRNSILANALNSGITEGIVNFYGYVRALKFMLSHSQRLKFASSSRPKRHTKTRCLEQILLEEPFRVKLFEKKILIEIRATVLQTD